MADLSINIGKLEMSNPVMTASGTFGYGLEFQDFVDLEKIGGIIEKAQPCITAREILIPVWQKLLWEC